MKDVDQAEEYNVVRVLNRFANCFDTKQWSEMENCLAPIIFTDYSDLRGTPPEMLANSRFVELRRTALDRLITHHLFANHEVERNGDRANARVSAAILRRSPDGETLNTHCIYLFELIKHAQGWLICGITQKVLWSDGNKQIHAGITDSQCAGVKM